MSEEVFRAWIPGSTENLREIYSNIAEENNLETGYKPYSSTLELSSDTYKLKMKRERPRVDKEYSKDIGAWTVLEISEEPEENIGKLLEPLTDAISSNPKAEIIRDENQYISSSEVAPPRA